MGCLIPSSRMAMQLEERKKELTTSGEDHQEIVNKCRAIEKCIASGSGLTSRNITP